MFILSLLYLALTIIRPQDFVPGLEGVPLLPVVLILAFLSWVVSSPKHIDAPQFLILPVFLLVTMLSQVTNGWTGGALDQLLLFGPTVIAFFVLAASCNSQRRVVIAMTVFVMCAVVLALHSVEQASTGIGWTGMTIGESDRVRYVGIFNDPNDLGLLFAATFPFAFYLSARAGFLLRIVWLAAAALLLYGIYLTNSRGALLATLVVAGVYVWRRRGPVTAAVLGVAGLAVMRLLSSRMDELSVDESSALGRVDAWYAGLHMFFSDPFFGVGAGNFTEYNDLTAHNSWILVLAETGFLGYVLWLAFVGYTFWMMITVLRYHPQPPLDEEQAVLGREEKAVAMTLLLSMCGLFASAFFLSRSYTVVMYLLLAVVVGYYTSARQRFPDLPAFRLAKTGLRWIPIALGSIFVLYVMVTVMLLTA
ncbi:MAG: O-antigen ligase family protein [Rhodanobacter sp.]